MNLFNKTFTVPSRELSLGELNERNEKILKAKQPASKTKNKNSFKYYKQFTGK